MFCPKQRPIDLMASITKKHTIPRPGDMLLELCAETSGDAKDCLLGPRTDAVPMWYRQQLYQRRNCQFCWCFRRRYQIPYLISARQKEWKFSLKNTCACRTLDCLHASQLFVNCIALRPLSNILVDGCMRMVVVWSALFSLKWGSWPWHFWRENAHCAWTWNSRVAISLSTRLRSGFGLGCFENQPLFVDDNIEYYHGPFAYK